MLQSAKTTFCPLCKHKRLLCLTFTASGDGRWFCCYTVLLQSAGSWSVSEIWLHAAEPRSWSSNVLFSCLQVLNTQSVRCAPCRGDHADASDNLRGEQRAGSGLGSASAHGAPPTAAASAHGEWGSLITSSNVQPCLCTGTLRLLLVWAAEHSNALLTLHSQFCARHHQVTYSSSCPEW